MKKEYCDKIERFFEDNLDKTFIAVNLPKRYPNHGDERFLRIFKRNDKKLSMIIHGAGNVYNPFEIKLIKVDENDTVDKQFETIEELMEYLENNLMDDLMVYGI